MTWIGKFAEIVGKMGMDTKVKPPVVEVYAKITVPILVVVPTFDGRYEVRCIGDGVVTAEEEDLENEDRLRNILAECMKRAGLRFQ